MNKEKIKEYLRLYDLDTEGFTYTEDCDDDDMWFDKALAVVDDAYHVTRDWEWSGISLQVLRDWNMELSPEGGWEGPVRYVVAWRDLPKDWFGGEE